MKLLDKIRANITSAKFDLAFNKLCKSGKAKPFDDEFFAKFEGMYYHGLPVYYYLCDMMSNGRCYDASAVLGLAMGEGAYVCRGHIDSQYGYWKGKTGHGWVETDTLVYDTTFKIICKKEDYYKVFKARLSSKRDYETHREDMSKITDVSIHDKKWFEENAGFSNLLIFQVRELEKLKLESKNTSEEEKDFARKVLNDLPNTKLEDVSNLEA